MRVMLRRVVGPRGLAAARRARWSVRRRMGYRRRLVPASRNFGYDRGTPIDRYYIDSFLAAHAGDVRGRVLEVGDDGYTRRFGRDVGTVDVVDIDAANPSATLVGDLGGPATLPREAFDCIICTQTLMFIPDARAVVEHLHRALRPGGVLLVTVSGISPICRDEMARHGDFWRFTSRSIRTLLDEFFAGDGVRVQTFGNVRSSSAFLYGLAQEELTARELDLHDPDFELIIGGPRAKPEALGARLRPCPADGSRERSRPGGLQSSFPRGTGQGGSSAAFPAPSSRWESRWR